ncbi:hypothetical protein V1523DRAFT_418843 [Lipomyces doorenjongii]
MQNVQFPWLPIGIDSAELISADFSEDDWQDEVERGMRDFVQFHVLHMAGPRDGRNVSVNSPLEFEAFAMFDREWAREVWELVRDDFRFRDACCRRSGQCEPVPDRAPGPLASGAVDLGIALPGIT